jgi:hypothetical protein
MFFPFKHLEDWDNASLIPIIECEFKSRLRAAFSGRGSHRHVRVWHSTDPTNVAQRCLALSASTDLAQTRNPIEGGAGLRRAQLLDHRSALDIEMLLRQALKINFAAWFSVNGTALGYVFGNSYCRSQLVPVNSTRFR